MAPGSTVLGTVVLQASTTENSSTGTTTLLLPVVLPVADRRTVWYVRVFGYTGTSSTVPTYTGRKFFLRTAFYVVLESSTCYFIFFIC